MSIIGPKPVTIKVLLHQNGPALWPERFSAEDMRKTQATLGPYFFGSLYQQDPRPEGGTEWPADWFGPQLFFEDWPKQLRLKVLALDPSKGPDAKAGDYSAFALLGFDREGCLWLDVDAARRSTPAIVERGLELYTRWQPQAFAVETNAYQELLGVEFLRVARARGITLPMYGINNLAPKAVRIRRLGPYLAQGRLRVRATAGGKQFVQEARDFPLGLHDDTLDACEMAIRMVDYLLGRRDAENQPQVLRAG